MLKKIAAVISLFLATVLLLPTLLSIPFYAEEEASTYEMGSIEEIIASYYDPNGRPMSCAHRAISAIGNPIPENSLAAIQDCIDHKIDIVELDIRRTSDGVYVLCHDETINRTTTYTGSKKISEMTYAEICQYPLLKYMGNNDNIYYDENGNTLTVPTLEAALKLCRDHVMINLDKFTGQWAYRMEIYRLVQENDCLDNVIFKGGYNVDMVLVWHEEIKKEYGKNAKMPNFCVMESSDTSQSFLYNLKRHTMTPTAFMTEIGYSDYNGYPTDPEVIAQAKQYVRVFTNVLGETLDSGHSAGHKENSTGFAEDLALGYNVLQTNNAADLAAYIYANFSTPTKDITKGIDMIHFTNFKHNQTSYTIEIQKSAVKLYNGDYISFDNVDFSSAKGNDLMISLAGHSGNGSLVIRKDATDGEIIAQFDLSELESQFVTVSEALTKNNLGVCTVYVCAENMGSGSVTAAKMICQDKKAGTITHVSGLSVFTKPGVAPALPATVTVTTDLGATYDAEVEWASVPTACYSENLSFFQVPGIIKDKCKTVYAYVTVLDLDMTGASVWFDSTFGIETDENGNVLTWYDRIQSIPAVSADGNAPAYRDNTLIFDGINDSLTYLHSISGLSNLSIILNANTDQKSTDYLSGYKINNSARYTLLTYPEAGDWGSVWLTGFQNGITCRFGSGGKNNRGIYYTGKTLNGWTTISAIKNATSEKFYLNGSQVYDRSKDTSNQYQLGSPGASIQVTREYAHIGYGIQQSANHYYEGEARDIVIFARTLNDTEIATLHNYFNAKNTNTLKDTTSAGSEAFASFLENNSDEIHSFVYTPADANTHTVVCEQCGKSLENQNHEYENGVCKYCSATANSPTTSDTPNGSDTPSNGSDTPSNGSDTPSNGSDTPSNEPGKTLIFIIIGATILVCAAATVSIILTMKKTKYR